MCEYACLSAAAVTQKREKTWRQTRLCCYGDRNRSTMARTRWPMTDTSKRFQSRSTQTPNHQDWFLLCANLLDIKTDSDLWSPFSLFFFCPFFFPDTCVSQVFTQRLPISSGSTAVAHGTSRSNCGRSSCMPGTPQQRRAKTKSLITCKKIFSL